MGNSETNTALCNHYDRCGGCSQQTTDYKIQLEKKEKKVQELFDRAGISDYQYLGIIPSPDIFAYRNKMEFSFGDLKKGGELQLGMHPRGRQYDVVTVDTCQLVDEDFRKILKTVITFFRQLGLKKYHVKLREGYLRQLIIRKGLNTGEILVNLVTTSQAEPELEQLVENLKGLNFKGKLVGFLQTINDDYADAVKCDELIIHYGRDYFFEELMGLKFKVKPFSFFQVNTRATEKLYETVKEFSGKINEKTIYDLYCGTGTIGIVMAQDAAQVIGIEVVEEAVDTARENANLNGLDNCTFIAGDVGDKLNILNEKPDLVIIDPPRPGIHKDALDKIIELNCRELIYVSCNPETLVRDLAKLQKSDYKVHEVKCVDMFPHTGHVESCARISK